MNSEKDNNRTDLAWSRLHDRLERDGLLTVDTVKRREVPFSGRIALRWAASLVLIACATLYILKDIGNTDNVMVSLDNTENTTLVKTLGDGSVIYLASGSQIRYPSRFSKERREVHLKGDAFFEVAKDKKAPFVIETSLMDIQVLGTSFNVSINDTLAPSLSVRTGIVKVTLREGGMSDNVGAGETAVIEDNSLSVVRTSDVNQFSRYSDRIHFKDERLIDVINVINRSVNKGAQGAVLSIQKGLEERLLTATFTENSPESIAQLICIALNLKYEIRGDVLVIYE